jgi:hypothetical protein
MPALQPIVTTSDEIQDAAVFVDGAGVAFVATALTTGRGIKVYRVQGTTVTPLEDATPPANSGVYSVSLQGSGADLVLVATGHQFVDKPRPNPVWQTRYPGVVTPLRADPYHAPGAFQVQVTPPPPPVVPPPPAGAVDAALAALVQAACTAALKAGGLVK